METGSITQGDDIIYGTLYGIHGEFIWGGWMSGYVKALKFLAVALSFWCCSAPGAMTPAEKIFALDKHNEHRRGIAKGDAIVAGETNTQPTASNMAKLQWDDDLATISQQHSDLCVFQHSDSNARINAYAGLTGNAPSWVGENIAIVGGSGTAAAESALRARLAQMHDGWTAEHKDYTYANQSCGGVCGHYTQVAWANSTRVGCGLSFCPDYFGAGVNAALLACAYFPGGNFNNQNPYEIGLAASNCPIEFPENDDGLCVAANNQIAAAQVPLLKRQMTSILVLAILLIGGLGMLNRETS